MIGTALSFPAGRFHATPWGRHVNEGAVEWPPSPWRFLRALVAVWKRKLDRRITEPDARDVLQQLVAPPMFVLPRASTGHTRHYMPWFKKGPDDRTLVFDAFVTIDRHTELRMIWPGPRLSPGGEQLLALLLDHLAFLGRAESWCKARLMSEAETRGAIEKVNCQPVNGEPPSANVELVRLLCADPRDAFLNTAFSRKVRRKRGKKTIEVEKKTASYDPDWHLCAETRWLHDERWSDPPGSRWVRYARRSDCFKIEPVPRASRAKPAAPIQVARFALDSSVLPLVTDTLRVAEGARRALMYEFVQAEGRRMFRDRWDYAAYKSGELPVLSSEVFSGKAVDGKPLAGHRHAHYLPTDEDRDGRLDHLTVIAEGGFGFGELAALDKLRTPNVRDRDQSRHPVRVILLGLGPLTADQAAPIRASATWVSATPFLAPRFPKSRGAKRDPPELLRCLPNFLQTLVREELVRLVERRPDMGGICPQDVGITPCLDEHGVFRIPSGGKLGLRPIQFARFRQKRGDDGGRRPAGAFRIVFPRPVRGPICLGHSSHFGLGLFVPETM